MDRIADEAPRNAATAMDCRDPGAGFMRNGKAGSGSRRTPGLPAACRPWIRNTHPSGLPTLIAAKSAPHVLHRVLNCHRPSETVLRCPWRQLGLASGTMVPHTLCGRHCTITNRLRPSRHHHANRTRMSPRYCRGGTGWSRAEPGGDVDDELQPRRLFGQRGGAASAMGERLASAGPRRTEVVQVIIGPAKGGLNNIMQDAPRLPSVPTRGASTFCCAVATTVMRGSLTLRIRSFLVLCLDAGSDSVRSPALKQVLATMLRHPRRGRSITHPCRASGHRYGRAPATYPEGSDRRRG
jgi:hypothetical protein